MWANQQHLSPVGSITPRDKASWSFIGGTFKASYYLTLELITCPFTDALSPRGSWPPLFRGVRILHKVKHIKKMPAKQDRKQRQRRPLWGQLGPPAQRSQAHSPLAAKFPLTKAPRGPAGTPIRARAQGLHGKPPQFPSRPNAVISEGTQDGYLAGTERRSLLPLKRFRFSWHTGRLPGASRKLGFPSSPFNAAGERHRLSLHEALQRQLPPQAFFSLACI